MKILLTFILASVPLSAQFISVGAKVGAPLNEAFNNDGGKFTFPHNTDRYILGGMAELRLPFGIGVEGDILYRRYSIGGTVNSWEFPIVAKYRFPGKLLRPYVEAGPSFNYVGLPGGLLSAVRPHASTSGIAIGGGVELKALIIRISPEIRYTRWTDKNLTLSSLNSGLSSNQSQFDFLVGISF